MNHEHVLRKELVESLQGRKAHLSFEEVIRDFPASGINETVPGVPYSAWELLEHLRITQWDILEFVQNPEHQSPDWPEGYWPKVKGDGSKWKAAVIRFLADRKALEVLVQDEKSALFSPLVHAPDYTLFREVILVIDHNAYHLGQLAMLRKALGIWP